MKNIKKFKDWLFEDSKTEVLVNSDIAKSLGQIIIPDSSDSSSKNKKSDYQDSKDYITSQNKELPEYEESKSLKISPAGVYMSPNLSNSDKYSILSRSPKSVRNEEDIFQICLHHTDGENKRGDDIIRYVYNKGEGYSVHYAIGRDGQLVKGSPELEKVWAANELNSHSVSIELSTGGGIALMDGKWLDGDKEGAKEISPDLYPLIIDLGFTYNGYRYYLDYTDGQMKSLKYFIDLMLKDYPAIKEGIKGNVYKEVFGISDPKLGGTYTTKKLTEKQAEENKGIFIHAMAPSATHVDCFPSSKLVSLLKTYGYTGNVLESTYVYTSDVKEVKDKNDKKTLKNIKGLGRSEWDPSELYGGSKKVKKKR